MLQRTLLVFHGKTAGEASKNQEGQADFEREFSRAAETGEEIGWLRWLGWLGWNHWLKGEGSHVTALGVRCWMFAFWFHPLSPSVPLSLPFRLNQYTSRWYRFSFFINLTYSAACAASIPPCLAMMSCSAKSTSLAMRFASPQT